jgi:hypothetical protein
MKTAGLPSGCLDCFGRTQSLAKECAQMQIATLLAFWLLAQTTPQQSNSRIPTPSVVESPPESIPGGTCNESYSGYLEITQDGLVKKTNLTAQEIGDYVKKRLSEGYSLSMYAQVSGRLFVIENCHAKH